MANNVVHCSFCGRSSDDAGKMLEGRDKSPGSNIHVSICLQCAAEAVEILSSANPEQAIGTPPRKFVLGDRVRVSQSYNLEYLRGAMGTIIIGTPDRRSDGIYVVEFDGSTVSYGEGYAVAGMEFESRFLEPVD
jgi:hypothetical protein